MFKIVDDFLPVDEFEKLKQIMMYSEKFPWYFNSYVVSKDGQRESKYDFQFVHTLYSEHRITSGYFEPVVIPFIQIIRPLALMRVKSNLTTISDKIVIQGFHTDVVDSTTGKIVTVPGHKTAVYYVNTNNGKTVFKDGTEVDSIENRLVVFDGGIEHSGTTCTDAKARYVINFNFIDNNFYSLI
jgi:hypothetical protein